MVFSLISRWNFGIGDNGRSCMANVGRSADCQGITMTG